MGALSPIRGPLPSAHGLPRASICFVLGFYLAAVGFAQVPRVETFSIADGLASDQIFDLAQDETGRLWIATRAGLNVYDGRELRRLSAADGLPAQVYTALEVDVQGRLWTVSRSLPRVYHRDGSVWKSLPEQDAAQGALATSLAVLGEGREQLVVVGTVDRGLMIRSAGSWSGVGAAQGMASDYVTGLAVRRGELFVGTVAGLCKLTGRAPDCGPRESDPRLRGEILALHAAAPDGRLWILGPSWLGYLDEGKLHTAAEGFEVRGFDPGILGAVGVDRAGGVYFGSPVDAFFLAPGGRRASRLGRRQGLAGEGLTTVFRDREGNVWTGSLQGLTKIESRRFLSLSRDQGLLEPEVSAVLEPVPGHFILGHETGLTFLDGQSTETVSFHRPATLTTDAYRVLDLAVDRRGTVWVAAETRGLLRLRTDRTWSEELPRETISAVEVDGEGRLWALGPHDLFLRGADGFSKVDLGLPDPPFLRWLEAGLNGRLFVATGAGILWRDGESWRRARAPSAAANNVYNILAEPSGAVWAGTVAGLYELRGEELVPALEGDLSVDGPVYLLLQDRRGSYWLGTDDGVYVWDGGQKMRHLTYRHGLAGRETNRGAGLLDHEGRVWIGTDRGVSIYQEIYDVPPAVAPGIELRTVEVNGERLAAGDVRLSHHQKNLTFDVGTIALSREEKVICRYRLDGFDEVWQGPLPVPATGIRYTNVPPGSYRFRIVAGWDGGAWGDEAVSARLVIDPPLWRAPWLMILAALAALAATVAGYRIRRRATRAMHGRQARLEALNVRLNEALAERGSLIAELEVRGAELERFAYTVSHDLKSPLVTVKGFLGFLQRDVSDGNAERVAADIAHIEEATEKMARLVDEILHLSRAGQFSNAAEEVDLGELAREAAELVGGRAAERGVAIEIAADLPVVSGDRTRLLEVIQNLLDNAVKYMGDQPHPRVEVGMREGKERVFFVRDNGAGIEPRYHDQIFRIFERLHMEVDGTGIGLSLVKRIVEVHGGRIWVESEGDGQGSTFCFTLSEGSGEGHDIL